MSKKILAFVLALVLVCSLIPAVAAAETSATISFEDKANRTAYSTASQVWQQNGITVTNNKDASTSNVGDYANPGRFYKSSTLIIAYPGMTKIEIDCSTKSLDAKYITAWEQTLDAAGIAYTNTDKIITVTLAEATDSLTLVMANQGRAFSMTVYAGGTVTPTEPTEPEATEPAGNLPTTPEEIVNAAYALASGETLEGTYTLTGVISSVDTAYSAQYQNVSVWMVVGNMTDKPILCYRLKGTGADVIGTGDTITVTGSLTNYNGKIEFAQGCTLDSYVEGSAPEENLTTPEEIVNAAYALEVNASLEKAYTLTGVISVVDTAYDAGYGNVTVTMIVGNMTDKPITCFRLKGEGADLIGVGDTITVTGNIKNYNGVVEFVSGCTLDSYVLGGSGETEPTEPEATEPTTPAEPETLTIAEALALGKAQEQGAYTTEKYKVTGVITEVENTTYGNLYITDGTDTLYIYGTYNADGSARYDAMEVKPDAGDTVTILGIVGNYNGNPQIKNGWILEYTEGEPPATEPVDPNSVVYDMTSYGVDGELGGAECSRELDENVTMTISAGWFTSQTRIYKNGNAVISSKVAMNSIVLNMAGNKAGNFTFPVSVSADGETWEVLDAAIAYTGDYTDITIELPEGCKYVKLEAPNAQIRIKKMTINFASEGGLAGDIDGNNEVSNDDVIALMWNVLFPDQYPLEGNVDMNKDGSVDNNDVIALMWYVLFPDQYPLPL